MARFATHTVGSQVLVLPKDLQYTPPTTPPANYVDELVNAKLQQIRVLPSELCSDEVFLRRVTIDITGLLPTVEEYQAFMADADPAKRAKLVDRLLERKEFSEIWAMKWANLLMVKTTNDVSYKSMFLYSNWLTNQISSNVPLNKMVQNLLSANGGTFKNPATNYYQIERDTLKTAENVAQVFMGIRTQCAQCHNHPFDRWTMDDYYSFAAFFAQIGRKPGEDYRETIVFNSGGGEVEHPVGGRQMPPKFLGGAAPDVAGKDRREVLVKWLASPENPYFATSVANRVWAHFLRHGHRRAGRRHSRQQSGQQPRAVPGAGRQVHFLQLRLQATGARHLQLAHLPAASQANASNEEDLKNFSHSRIRRIPAENLLDCLSQVTEIQEKFQGLPLGARAVQIADGQTSNYFLTSFGRSPRTTVCAAEATTEPTLSQALHMLNGDTLTRKMGESKRLQKLLDAGKSRRRSSRRSTSLACRASRAPRKCRSSKPCWPPSRTPARRGRHFLGRAQLARILVQSLMRSAIMIFRSHLIVAIRLPDLVAWRARRSCRWSLADRSEAGRRQAGGARSPTTSTCRPIFREHCFSCHNQDTKKSDLSLATFAGRWPGGASGEVVVPGDPDSSRLWAWSRTPKSPRCRPIRTSCPRPSST